MRIATCREMLKRSWPLAPWSWPVPSPSGPPGLQCSTWAWAADCTSHPAPVRKNPEVMEPRGRVNFWPQTSWDHGREAHGLLLRLMHFWGSGTAGYADVGLWSPESDQDLGPETLMAGGGGTGCGTGDGRGQRRLTWPLTRCLRPIFPSECGHHPDRLRVAV